MAVVRLTAKGAGAQIFLNPDQIVSFFANDGGSEITVTAVRNGNSVQWPVNEAPDQVAQLIRDAILNRG